MMVKIEQSIVYPDVWYLRLDKVTLQVTKQEVDEIINEARRIYHGK